MEMARADKILFHKLLHLAVTLALLFVPASSFSGPNSKSPVVACERIAGENRPLYAHPNLAAFRNPRSGALPAEGGMSIRVRDPESGIVVYQVASAEKAALKAALGKRGFSEIPAYATPDGRWVVPTDQLVVQFRREATQAEVDAFLAARGGKIVRSRRNHHNQFVVEIADPAFAMKTAADWYSSDLVEWAQANCLRESKPRFMPNDAHFSQQWYLHNTNQSGSVLNRDLCAERAWDITRGNTNVIVAVLDDGFELTHPDLAANVFSNSAELVDTLDNDGNGYTNDYWGWDFWHDDNDPSPVHTNDAHGMATAGLILAAADNGLGVAGVANLCKLLPVRVYSDDVVKDINWADAVEYAAELADVLSISYFIEPAALNHDALRYAVTSGRGGKGCVVCAALGNDGVYRRYMADLATAPEVLSVSGNSNYDKRSWFGDYGPSLRLVGPAGGGNIGISSTDRTGADGYDPTDYCLDVLEGTSFSCPLAAGVAALVISEHPTWSGLAVRRQIEATCDKIDAEAFPYNSAGWNDRYGFGRLNARAALATPPAPWDPYETDNTAGTAHAIEDGEMQYRSLNTGADADWVSFSLATNSDIQLTVVGTTNAGMELYNSAETLIATNTSGSPSYCYLVVSNQSAGTYYARVFSPPSVAIPNYGLHFGILNFKDSYEGDNARANAKSIAPRQMQYRTLYPGTDDDWVTFTLPRAADIDIWTMGEIEGDTVLVLRNASQQLIATNDDGYYNAPYSHIAETLLAGTYYIHVTEYYSAALPSYQLVLEVYDIDNYETNNAPAQATPIASGGRLSCTLHPSGDEDWFIFSVSNRANALLLTDSQNPYWGGDTIITLFDSNLVELAQNDEGNNYSYSAIFITNLAAGVYYAKVEGWSGSTDPDYYFALDIYSSEAELTSVQQDTNGIGIAWTGDASFDYRVEVASNLVWNVVTNLEGHIGENRWTDPGTTTSRWYRVVTP